MAAAVIVEYDPEWPVAAQLWLDRIRGAVSRLPDSASFELDHIGSTAVPGLAAKPIIDLQLLAPNLPDENGLADALAPIGFTLANGSRPDSPGVRFDIPRPSRSVPDPAQHAKLLFHRPSDRIGPEMILHVRLDTSPFAGFVLAFRDWLRESPTDAHEYEAIKRRLAAEHAAADDYDDYTHAKTAFMDHAQSRMGWSGMPRDRSKP